MDVLSDVILQIYRAAREQPVDEFQDFILGIVGSVIPFTSSRWVTADVVEKRGIVRFVHIRNEPDDTASEWEAVSHQDRYKDMMVANPGTAMTIHSQSFFTGPDEAEMLDYTRRYQHANTLGVILPTPVQNQWEALSLYRAAPDHHYLETERRMLEKLMPHLAEACAHNRMHALHSARVAVDGESSAVAIAQGNGSLCYTSKRFITVLQREWPDWKGHKLPAALHGALTRAGSQGFNGGAIIVNVTRMGELMFLRASRSDPLCRLSPREALVARLYGEGHSYKEISKQINVAPATVRVFLKRIYEKLGIADKAQLGKLLARSGDHL